MNLKRIPMRPWLLALLLALAPISSAEWNEKVLYSFQGGNDGSFPGGGVVFDQQGNLYGVTEAGGPPSCAPIGSYCGTVYELSPSIKGGPWTKTLLYMFKGKRYNDGEVPDGLIIDQAGNLYGVTAYGGTGGCVLVGVPAGCGPTTKGGAWTEKTLFRFNGQDGATPAAGVVFGKNGNLYGTASAGATRGNGAVFDLAPAGGGGPWKETVLHLFIDGNDGTSPEGGLVFDATGSLCGTAGHIKGGAR